MLSGRETLGHLDGTLSELRKQLGILDRELQAMSSHIARTQLQRSEVLKQLAILRLDSITSDEVGARLDSAERQVRQLLAQREDAITEVNKHVAEYETSLDKLESTRTSLHKEVDAAAAALAEREAAAQERLENDPDFKQQLEQTRAADAVAVGAAEKASVAAEDSREKSAPYNSDPLFSYLWNRQFGTSEYRANLLTRAIDGWVARLCRFESARRDYWLLLEIPKRLQQHAAAVRAHADSELEALQALEARAAEAGGVVSALDALTDAEHRQDKLDERIAALEGEILQRRTTQGEFAAGEDAYLSKCLEVLEVAMKHRSIDDLTRIARATMTLEDDDLVDRLRLLRREEQGLQSELDEHRNIHRETLKRMQELTDVRQRFKSRRYDDLRSGFDNGDLLLMLMRQVLVGTLPGGSLWDALSRHQRYNDVTGAWPDFGSGGIARRMGRKPTGRPTWHWPGAPTAKGKNKTRGKGFRLPKGSGRPGNIGRSRGRGGFRTGGGF